LYAGVIGVFELDTSIGKCEVVSG